MTSLTPISAEIMFTGLTAYGPLKSFAELTSDVTQTNKILGNDRFNDHYILWFNQSFCVTSVNNDELTRKRKNLKAEINKIDNKLNRQKIDR